jgi:hypothetical protein
MRHVKRYNELFEAQTELSQEQIEWLDKCTKGHWFHNPETGLVDVDGDFGCFSQGLTDFKGVRFGVVTGTFNCGDNQLTSLEGAPLKVGWYFICDDNQITSLEGAPRIVGVKFRAERNPVSERTLKDIYNKMQSGMAWEEAVEMQWDYMDEDDRTLLARYNPKLSPEEIKGYQALAKFRNKII